MLRSFISLIFYLQVFISGAAAPVKVGAECMDEYLPLLQGKKVALVANHTTYVGNRHLLDTLQALNIKIQRVFAPEHGFRGTAEAGKSVVSYVDKLSGVEVASIYGATKKPKPEQLRDVDVVVFDMQDVGVRFYTYLSTLHYVMEACAERGVPVMVLDRPNPNGSYVDGPVLNPKYRSFVGMHPIPIVHGMTLGELAQMLNGEGWLKKSVQCKLTVITCKDYTHAAPYVLPVKPSPNLPNQRSIYLYPSLCIMEGTIMSIARGTTFPFQAFGHPDWKGKTFSFTPKSIKGVANHPPHEGKVCHGVNLQQLNDQDLFTQKKMSLDYIVEAYRYFAEKEKFFTKFFTNLTGTDALQKQIEQGLSAEQIRATWQPDLDAFKKKREKYLLYN
ncbi:MAG: DUF1343 domain-containing protein [Prevotellaceae bacterium]|jgi:uncharacterized protein YbbC (DUF1343 family)|nr:DUF1343 domain-containing protein [Prevotellaceae bacterium]